MAFDKLDHYAAVGQGLLDGDDAARTHTQFARWVDDVRDWLSLTHPNSGIAAEWIAQSTSPLVVGGQYHDDHTS